MSLIQKMKDNTNVTWRWMTGEMKHEFMRVDEGWNIEFITSIDDLWLTHSGTEYEYAYVYRLKASWNPPIKAPDGHRIVSREGRERCAYPKDTNVKWANASFITGEWFDVILDNVWLNSLHIFAVPTDYVFKEDRKSWYVDMKSFFDGDDVAVARFIGNTMDAWVIWEGRAYEVIPNGHYSISDFSCEGEQIEVKEEELPYLIKPEGDWEFRNVQPNKVPCAIHTPYCATRPDRKGTIANICSDENILNGYRWCKPLPKWHDGTALINEQEVKAKVKYD